MATLDFFFRAATRLERAELNMKFIGIRKVFSTKNEEQYSTIGAFWDEMSAIYGRENLMGLGCFQAPDRTGELFCKEDGIKVSVTGNAVLFGRADILE